MNPIVTDWLTREHGLADRLRSLRRAANLPGTELGTRVGWNQSKVSRLETGRTMPSASDIRAWVDACGKPGLFDELLDLLGEAQSLHFDWKRRERHGLAAVQATYNEMIEAAKVVRHFEVTFVPGMLQTPDYARHLLTGLAHLDAEDDIDGEDIELAVSLRMQRQQWLYSPTKQFEFLLSESVLRWLLAPVPVMVGQLDRLLAAFGLPNVRVGIVPFGVELPTAPQNKFEVHDGQAVVETFVGETIHSEADSEAYLRILDRLWSEAVEGEDARRLVIRALRDLQGGSGGTSAT